MPRNSLLNGKVAPDTGGLQLDETSYPILMAWQSGLAGDGSLYRNHVIPAADFLVAHGPIGRRRALGGAGRLLAVDDRRRDRRADRGVRDRGDEPRRRARARLYQATADQFARKIKDWTVTTTGPYAPRYFIRLSKTGDPNAAISYDLGNGSITADQRSIVDAGFLELVRLGVLPASDPDVSASLGGHRPRDRAPDSDRPRLLPLRHGRRRLRGRLRRLLRARSDELLADRRAVAADGPRLRATCGRCSAASAASTTSRPATAAAATQLLDAMAGMTSGGYLEPEQAWEDPAVAPSPFGTDPATASIGFSPGHPAGSASPLTWAQSQYARLALALGAGRDLETPQVVTARYVTHGMPGTLPLTISSPTNGSNVTGSTVTVSGTTTARARVDVEAAPPTGGTRADRLDDGRRQRQLVAPGAGQLRHDEDHRDRDEGRQHRLHPAVGHQRDAAGHQRARRHRPDRRRQRPRDVRVSDERRLPAGRVRPDRLPGHADRRPTSTSRRRSRTWRRRSGTRSARSCSTSTSATRRRARSTAAAFAARNYAIASTGRVERADRGPGLPSPGVGQTRTATPSGRCSSSSTTRAGRRR